MQVVKSAVNQWVENACGEGFLGRVDQGSHPWEATSVDIWMRRISCNKLEKLSGRGNSWCKSPEVRTNLMCAKDARGLRDRVCLLREPTCSPPGGERRGRAESRPCGNAWGGGGGVGEGQWGVAQDPEWGWRQRWCWLLEESSDSGASAVCFEWRTNVMAGPDAFPRKTVNGPKTWVIQWELKPKRRGSCCWDASVPIWSGRIPHLQGPQLEAFGCPQARLSEPRARDSRGLHLRDPAPEGLASPPSTGLDNLTWPN